MSSTSLVLSKWIDANKSPTTDESTNLTLSSLESTTLELLLEAVLGPKGLLAWVLNFLRDKYLPPAVPLSLSASNTSGAGKPIDIFRTNTDSFAATHSDLFHLLVDMTEAVAVDLIPSPERIGHTGTVKPQQVYRIQLHSHVPSVRTVNTLRLEPSVLLIQLSTPATDVETNNLTNNSRISASSSISSRVDSSSKAHGSEQRVRFINPCVTFRYTEDGLSCEIEGFYTQSMCMAMYSFPVSWNALSPLLLSKAEMKATRPLSVLLESPSSKISRPSTDVDITRLCPRLSVETNRQRSLSANTSQASLELNMQWDDNGDTDCPKGLINWSSVVSNDTTESNPSKPSLIMEDVCELFSIHSICCFREQIPEFIGALIDSDLRITSFELRIGQCNATLPLSPVFSHMMNQLLQSTSSPLSVISGSFHFRLPVSSGLSLRLPKNACRLLPMNGTHSLTFHWKARDDERKLVWECVYSGCIQENHNKVTGCEFTYHSTDDFLVVQYAGTEASGNGSTRCVVYSNCVQQNIILSRQRIETSNNQTGKISSSVTDAPTKQSKPKKSTWNWLCCTSPPDIDVKSNILDSVIPLPTIPSEFNCIALGATQLRLMLHSLPNSVCRLFRLNPLLNPVSKLGRSRLNRLYSVCLERVIPPRFVAQPLLTASRSAYLGKMDLSATFAQFHSMGSSEPFTGEWFVGDQGNIGACTAFAILSVCTFFWPSFSPSHLFQYYNQRMLDGGLVNSDSGSSMAYAVTALKAYHMCHENIWPYSLQLNVVRTKPSDACYQQALELAHSMKMIFEPVEIESADQLEPILAGGSLIVLGIIIYQSFESERVAKTGLVPMPRVNEVVMGGHAVCICGYDRENEVLKVKNSWGKGWGDKGYFYLPYNYITQQHLATDAWKCTHPLVPIVDTVTL